MLGFIGVGNMAGAILRGIVDKNVLPAGEVTVFDVDARKVEDFSRSLGVTAAASAEELVERSDIVLLGVKPHIVQSVLDAQRENLRGKAVFSIATGWGAERLRGCLHGDTRYLSIMPNTPALVGEGMTALNLSHTLTDAERELAERIFAALGRIVWLEDRLMDAAILSGSGPAYAFLFIEAMADGGVYCGLPRAKAIEMAAQALLGAAKMVLETGLHPGELKDMVTSPGGTTIAAIRSLENDGFRGSVTNAVCTSIEKAASLRK